MGMIFWEAALDCFPFPFFSLINIFDFLGFVISILGSLITVVLSENLFKEYVLFFIINI